MAATRPKRGMAQRLFRAYQAVEGALADEMIRAAVAPFGYTEERLLEGRALVEEAQRLVAKQRLEYGEQYEASQQVQQAWATARTAYARTLKVARIALRGNSLAEGALLLRGERHERLSGWLEQATTFYRNLLDTPDLLAALHPFGYTPAVLAHEVALVEAVRAASIAQQYEKGEAHAATQQRDAALATLDAWLADFKAIAQVALAANPQWLEKLGFGPV